MKEKIIEQKFRGAVRAAGGMAVKFVSPGWRFSLVGGWHLWRARLPERSPARSRKQGIVC